MYKIFDKTQFVGKQVIFLPKCRSTNDMASEKMRNGILGEGSIIITDHQYAGKGQRGNKWESNVGENLTFSIVLEPTFIHPTHIFYLNIITSLAIIETLIHMGNHDFKIKWPNDIMYKNLKLGGILIETNIQSSRIKYAVIGIGLNVNQSEFYTTDQATSLKNIFNTSHDLNAVFNKVIRQFEEEYMHLKSQNMDELVTRYLSNLYWLNEKHIFKSTKPNREFQGVIKGIDGSGRLQIDVGNRISTFNFKEIVYLR